MNVHIPGPLRSYTGGWPTVEATGHTVGELLGSLDRAYPGFRFRIIDEQDRIRDHIKIFVDSEQIRELSLAINGRREVQIICALTGGLGCPTGRTAPIGELL